MHFIEFFSLELLREKVKNILEISGENSGNLVCHEGGHPVHLKSAAEMIPYFFSFDQANYSRWAPVYIADMHRLQETAPDVHQELMNVKRSKNKFNQVWSDMALEQSVNRDSKTKGGIVGIILQKNALDSTCASSCNKYNKRNLQL